MGKDKYWPNSQPVQQMCPTFLINHSCCSFTLLLRPPHHQFPLETRIRFHQKYGTQGRPKCTPPLPKMVENIGDNRYCDEENMA